MTKSVHISMISPNWLGDAVMSLPLVGLFGAAPDVALTVIAPERTARVYLDLDGVDTLLVLSRKGLTRGVSDRRRYLRQTRPNGVVVLPPSFSSALGPALAGVPVRAGYRADGRGMLLTDALAAGGSRREHLSENYLRLGDAVLRRLGASRPDVFETPSVTVTEANSIALDRILETREVPPEYAVLVPGATFGPAKSWPWEQYRDVAGELSKDLTVVMAGTAGERETCERIAREFPNVKNLAGDTPLGEFLALLSRARVVLANDSGSPHLAASIGTPVVVLFGSTSPVWTAPLGKSVDVIQHPVHCSPCFRKHCPENLECFDGITVDGVLERTRRAMLTPGPAGAPEPAGVARENREDGAGKERGQ